MNQLTQHYRSEDGEHYFTFRFQPQADHVDIHVLSHPGFNGQDASAHKTHLFADGKVCLVAGREPQDMDRALELAKQWAEYFVQYRATGVAQQ